MAEQNERGLVEYQSRDGQNIKLSFDVVRKFLVSGRPEFVTDQEIVFYMGTCKARGLNPFKKDCYLVKYTQNDNAACIVSIDYYRSRAKAMPDCQGWSCGIIVKNGDKVVQRGGSFLHPGDELLGGWFRAKPKGWFDEFEWSVSLAPYVKKKANGEVTRFWSADNQPSQICKVAESQGLRHVWPDEFQGLYVEGDEVLDLRDVTPIAQPGSIDDNNAGEPEAKPKAKPKAEVEAQPKAEGSLKQAALDWIEAAPDDEILDGKTLSAHLKGLTQGEQLRVCTAFNQRKNKITDELKAGS